jgi:hypothetical protein
VRDLKDYSRPFIPDRLISLILPAELSFLRVGDVILIFAEKIPEGLLSVAQYSIGKKESVKAKGLVVSLRVLPV